MDMATRVGVVVCNFNKKEYAKNCVESLLAQSYENRDVFVVDNASTDGSVQLLNECFGEQITILQNEENLGGAGGFSRGVDHCMGLGYRYIMLVDNDTRFDVQALERLVQYLEFHDDVGMCGAGVLQMGNPEYIQEIGGMIDYKRYDIVPNYRNQKLTDEIPETVDCDFLAACALLVKREVIENVGGMRRDYFVYWDDIEWSRRCKDAGYRLVALRDAHVWHNWSANVLAKFNAFTEYYGRRNKFRFFATYLEDEELDVYLNGLLRGLFNIIYGHYRKGAFAEMQVTLHALDDMIHNVWGKAPITKTSIEKPTKLPLEYLLEDVKKVCVLSNEQMGQDGGVPAIERVLRFCNSEIEIVNCNDVKEMECILWVKPCTHVMQVEESVLPVIYVDRFMNCICTEDDFRYFDNSENVYGLFYQLYISLLKEGVRKIREERK